MAANSESRRSLLGDIKKSLDSGDLGAICQGFASAVGSEAERKTILDQTFRDVLKEKLQTNDLKLTDLVTLATSCVKEGMCSAALPFILLGDAFDCVTLDVCEKAFSYVENNVALWTSPLFYSSGKNFLLRMCNDLLRRLSPSRNTVFCGRIQLFLARIFPLSEKSGLNLMSQFNIENITTCAEEPDTDTDRLVSVTEDESAMEEGETPALVQHPIDFELYRQFWKLQDCFREPPQCYTTDHWKTLKKNTEKVLDVFASFKLEHLAVAPLIEVEGDSDGDGMSHCYFTKYLTSEKLLDLQIRDSKFRQHILVQFLILFQYLTGTVKFKGPSHVLKEDQVTWIKQMTEKVYSLLRETPPCGQEFAKTVEHILTREQNWITWKNDSCKTFVRDKTEPPNAPMRSRRSRKRFYPSPNSSAKRVDLGSPELTRLWNLGVDNMEACCSQDRDFLPGLHDFFEEAVEQSDPEAMIEDDFKIVNNSSYVWRALRLLSRRGTSYFQASSSHQQQHPSQDKGQGPTQGMKAMSHYLESVVTQLTKEKAMTSATLALSSTGSAVSSPATINLEMDPKDSPKSSKPSEAS